MGLVLAFQSTPRPASRAPERRPEPAQSADILFFTGVRFERHETAPIVTPATPSDAPDQALPAS